MLFYKMFSYFILMFSKIKKTLPYKLCAFSCEIALMLFDICKNSTTQVTN